MHTMYAARQAAARALGRMARFSLLPVAMTCASGCFDPVPEYSEPTRVPPVIAADKCIPSTTLLVTPATTPPVDAEFKVAFRADDIGLNLHAKLYRDLTLGHRALLAEKTIPSDPRAFADQSPLRTVSLLWQWTSEGDSAFGCHILTAVITDVNNFDGLYDTFDPLEEARITWFVWLQNPMNSEVKPVTCLGSESNGVSP